MRQIIPVFPRSLCRRPALGTGNPEPDCDEQTQSRLGGNGRGPTGTNRANKANCAERTKFGGSGVRGKHFMGKRLWRIGPAIDLGKTKPIRMVREGPRPARVSVPTVGPSMRNKANLPGPDPKGRWWAGFSVKQSQSPHGGEGPGPARPASVAGAGRIAPNKANLRGEQPRVRAGKVAYAGGAGPKRAKQTQFKESRTSGKCFRSKWLWRVGHAKALGKQSQFPDGMRGRRILHPPLSGGHCLLAMALSQVGKRSCIWSGMW